METNEGIKSWQWIVTAIVIMILIVLGYYMLKGNNNTPNNTGNTDLTEEEVSNEINRVMVSDQYPGNVVLISSVQFEKPGFVVIHEDKDGMPGDIIGSTYFDKGINTGKIMLTKNTVEGNIYYAMLHSDNSDKVFDFNADLPLKNAKGDIIMKTFRATSDITEIKG